MFLSEIAVSLLVRLWVEIVKCWHVHGIHLVSLLVRLWVEISVITVTANLKRVSLLVRLWVEIGYGQKFNYVWGVSLLVRLWVEISKSAYWCCEKSSQPPCEAVSWNVLAVFSKFANCTSASLWGCELKWGKRATVRIRFQVSLLVRLWVEICNAFLARRKKGVSLLVRLWVEMVPLKNSRSRIYCQPPCEAVSWNMTEYWKAIKEFYVSLLVRLWVEINVADIMQSTDIPSASLWGCELKFNTRPYSAKFKGRQPPCEAVSWNMGTTEPWHIPIRQPPCEAVSWNRHTGEHCITDWLSASLWGCELKSGRASKLRLAWSQPPCEAVSWNIQWAKRKIVPPFRQPPCEAVSWNSIRIPTVNTQRRQPPCEAVSWNMGAISGIGNAVKSASLWGCELK